MWTNAQAVHDAKSEHTHAMVLLGATAALTVADVLQGGADAATDVATASAGRAAVRAIMGGGGELLSSACPRVAVEFERLAAVGRQVAAGARTLRLPAPVARYASAVAKGTARRALVGGGVSTAASAAGQVVNMVRGEQHDFSPWNLGIAGLSGAATGVLLPGGLDPFRVAVGGGVSGGATEFSTEWWNGGHPTMDNVHPLKVGLEVGFNAVVAGGGAVLARALPHLPVLEEGKSEATEASVVPSVTPEVSAENEGLNKDLEDMFNAYWGVGAGAADVPTLLGVGDHGPGEAH